MSFNQRIQNAVSSLTSSADTIASGLTAPATAITMAGVVPGTLSARCTVLAETNTITLAVVWEVSDDNATFYRAASITNAAPTVFGTGTAGADTAVTRVIQAPDCVYAYRYARAAVLVGVTTGAATDTFTISYNYLTAPFI